jgi:hypothetical protein
MKYFSEDLRNEKKQKYGDRPFWIKTDEQRQDSNQEI